MQDSNNTIISSAENAIFKKLLSLTTSKGLKKEGLFLLSGQKLITEFLAKPTLPIHYQITTKSMRALRIAADAPTLTLASPLFQELDVLGTKHPILVLAQPDIAQWKAADWGTYKPEGLDVVLPVGDPGNLGALLRSCVAFGTARILLTSEAAHPYLPKCVKASAGSVLRIPMARVSALAEIPTQITKRLGLALDAQGKDIYSFAWPENTMLIMGEEGPGLGNPAERKQRFKQLLSIPTTGVESLNVVVAASIALALYRKNRSQ